MTSKNAQSMQDLQGWGATGGVSGKAIGDIGFDFGASRVDDPNNKKGRVVDAETISFGLGAVADSICVACRISWWRFILSSSKYYKSDTLHNQCGKFG